jgi:hypothetical protein
MHKQKYPVGTSRLLRQAAEANAQNLRFRVNLPADKALATHLVAAGLLEPGYFITEKGGDVLAKEHHHFNPDAMACHSEGDSF